jgi:hypothetical protein
VARVMCRTRCDESCESNMGLCVHEACGLSSQWEGTPRHHDWGVVWVLGCVRDCADGLIFYSCE